MMRNPLGSARFGRHRRPDGVASTSVALTAPAALQRRKRVLTALFATVLAAAVAAQLHVLNPGGPKAHASVVQGQPLVAGRTLSGVVAGTSGPSGVSSFGSWRGKPAEVITVYSGTNTWDAITNISGEVGWWGGTNAHRVWSVPLLPLDNSATLASAAAGAYNSKYYAIGQGLVAGGDGSATIRLGWELNGDWYTWSMSKNPSAFAQAWRNAINQMRSVPGAHFTFDFNVSPNYPDPTPAWPGDAYVDIVSMDLYDYSWASYSASDHVAAWNGYLTEKTGLNWLASFASAHGKRIAFPEWAEAYRCDGHGGGDDTYFIQQMHNWIASHNVAYETYFNADDDSCHRFVINGGYFPNAANLYKSLLNSTSTPPPTTAPTTTKPPTVAPTTTKPPTTAPTTTKPPTTAPTTTKPVTTTAPATSSLDVTRVRASANASRADDWPIVGSVLSSNRYIFLNAPSGTVKVAFYLDRSVASGPTRTETSAPYDMEGTNGANAYPWNASAVTGSHTLIVQATMSNGSVQTATVSFTTK